MVKGFVFGKFLPFHKGHEAMIRFALLHCDALTVLICSSDRELINGLTRKQWIETTIGPELPVMVLVYDYEETLLPNSSVSSRDISKAWANVFTALLPDHSILVTSEPYGDYLAEYMNITHIPFDKLRHTYPVSSSEVNTSLTTYWSYLPDSVKPHFIRKVVILGTESTGKSTLAKDLADHFPATLITEAGRDLISDSNDFTIDDLYKVAAHHAQRIGDGATGDSALMVIDTDIHITQSYARHIFRQELNIPPSIYELNKADLYLYLNNDVAFVQDGTRLDEEERNRLDQSHRDTLAKYGIPFHEISGNWQQRFDKAVTLVSALAAQKMIVRK